MARRTTRKNRRRNDRPKPNPESAINEALRRANEENKRRKTAEEKRKADQKKKTETGGAEFAKSYGRAADQKFQFGGRAVDNPRGLPEAGPRGAAKRDEKPGPPVGTAEGLLGLMAPTAIGEIDPARLRERDPLADPDLYGSARARAEKLNQLMAAADSHRTRKLRNDRMAVYMGPRQQNAKLINPGRERIDADTGKQYTEVGPVGDNIIDKNQLMAWLADEQKVALIKSRAQAAGLDVQTYEDVAKLWESVLDQAAMTFSTTLKKVTPWALMALRGKMAPGGRQRRTTVSTAIEEMDPAQARLMFDKAASDYLGRAARPDEIDDFIAKAQTIAKNNPRVTKTTTEYGFDGEAETQFSSSTGGSEVVNAQSQVAAIDAAKQDEGYEAYQAAGIYGPLLFEALKSPV